ncbi:MAG: twin-arginine translocase subunit TatC [Actinobacteria bacterium]|nr:twin-arginine translocase subunit TatC [Actinomycetota bacterium]NCA26019.1 twin-arginine translocase subunit TatC [Actinomycetota bacterium]NCU96862.1 twin-arginine translocase subunit TatC [Actinomycetota bacterium]NCZ76930.1 twin-arginine translocase subunit TatC [Actinomycetota bacterium]
MSKQRGGKMPLLDHLREFRNRLIKSLFGISLAALLGWYFYQSIIRFLTLPFCDLGKKSSPSDGKCGELYVNGILGPFNLQVKISLLAGVILAAPIWIYQLWSFITPALHRKEKRVAILFSVIATPLFATGTVLAYLILPHAVDVLLGFTPDNLGNLVRFDEYLDFVLRLILIFGIAFVLPLFLVALNLLGLLSGKSILKPWRTAVFICFLFTAAFTPTPDPITMTLLAIPLCLIYFLSGLFALLADRRKSKKNITSFGVSPIDKPESI